MRTIIYIFLLSLTSQIHSQVGINTTTPEGVLDVSSATGDPAIKNGFVYPVVSLTDITVQQISNPNPDPLVTDIIAGTIVYNDNTNTPANIENSVYPGIYVWDGSKWVPQFSKRDSVLFDQLSDLRTGSDDLTNPVNGDQSILFDVSGGNYPFRPKYNGRYKIKVSVHYGGGNIDAPNASTQFVNFGAQEGQFIFTFNGGTPHTFEGRSFSGYNTDRLFNSPATANSIYTNNYTQTFYVIEEDLDTTNTYTFTLTFNQEDAPGFEGDGDIGVGLDGRGHITVNDDVSCTVEFTYVGE